METIEVLYQAPNSESGRTINMKVYKPDHTEDATQAAALTEIGTTGRYYGSVDVDAPNWECHFEDAAGGGKAIKLIDKLIWGVLNLITVVGDIQTAVDNVSTAIGDLQTLAGTMDGKLDSLGADLTSVGGLVTSLGSQLGVIEGKIDDIKTPPQVG